MRVGIFDFLRKDKPLAITYIKSLVDMAAVDGNIHARERALLLSIAKQHKVSEERLNVLEKDPKPAELVIPECKKERFEQLYNLVLMMSVDNLIHDREMKLCKWFVAKFGFSEKRSGEIVESIRLNIQNGRTSEEAYQRLDFLINHC